MERIPFVTTQPPFRVDRNNCWFLVWIVQFRVMAINVRSPRKNFWKGSLKSCGKAEKMIKTINVTRYMLKDDCVLFLEWVCCSFNVCKDSIYAWWWEKCHYCSLYSASHCIWNNNGIFPIILANFFLAFFSLAYCFYFFFCTLNNTAYLERE